MGTVHVLEAARHVNSVRCILNVTTDKCYENREWVWGYRENDPLGGHDPYSASKGCAELVFAAYLRSFFCHASGGAKIGAASVRAGNVIGGGDWGKDRLVPDCIRALSVGKAIGLRNPHAIRPWQHVLEPLGGYLRLGAALWQTPDSYAGSWNFGPDEGSHLTVADMTERLVRCWGSGSWEDLSDPGALHEATLLKLNCDKAHAALRWHSVLTIDDCLQMTADWYKTFYTKAPSEVLYALCVEQIRLYMGMANKRG